MSQRIEKPTFSIQEMSKISAKQQSLNIVARKQESKRINSENSNLLRTLSQSKPTPESS